MKVVIATEGDRTSSHAIEEAIRLLPLSEADIVVVSVVDLSDRITLAEDVEKHAAAGVARLREAGLSAEAVVRRGDPAEEIVAIATETNADVVVVGAARRGRIAQFFLGSISRQVMQSWKGAILVVRSPG
jgi:nucleotide-binding universal stress UspA family protein